MHHIEIVSRLEATHLEQLPELLAAATRADAHEPIGEHKFLRLQRSNDLGVAVLAYEDQRLAGYAHTVSFDDADARRVSCEFVVAPEFRRRGVGRMLLSHSIMHALSQDAARMDVWAYNDSAASAHLAAQFGFAPVRRLHHLHRHTTATTAASPPRGIALRPFRPGEDDAAWLDANNRIFAAHPENGSWTLDDLCGRLSQPWFAPDDFLIAEADGHIAAFCWLKIEERGAEGRVGEIYVIGVAPEYRGRGLARYLLGEGLRRMQLRGAGVAAVYVDETNATARALYDAYGFHRHHVDVCYSRPLGQAARDASPPVIELAA